MPYLAALAALLLGVSEARAQLAGQIVVDPDNTAWLVRFDPAGNHAPFFMAGPGDPEDFLYRGSQNPDGTRVGDQQAIIDKLAMSGANSLYFQAVRSHGGDGDESHNPWTDPLDPSSPLNAAVLDQWEGWFQDLEAADVTLFFFVYDDSSEPFGRRRSVIGPAETALLNGLVDRFEHHANLIWVVAEEYDEGHTNQNVSDIAAIMRAADDHDHVIAVHQSPGEEFDFPDDPNIDQFAVQLNSLNAAQIQAQVESSFNAMLATSGFNLNMSESIGHYDPLAPDRVHTRQFSWAAAMGGAYVMVYQMDVIGTPIEILEDHGRLVEFFEQTDFNRMAPRSDLVAGASEYVLSDSENESFIAYGMDLAPGEGLGVIGLSGGVYELFWFDPETGPLLVEHIYVDGGAQIFTGTGTPGERAVWINKISPVPALPGVWGLLLAAALLALSRRQIPETS